ncbi:hypothetical protein GCM10027085_65490 [Spirosoma aerophilum]
MSEKLFDDKIRTNLEYALHQHDSYEFYDNSAKDEFVVIREMLNDWFSRYPDNHKWNLKRDFQSDFDSAFFELFIHELFSKQGFQLTPHPALPDSTNHPDFLAKKGDIEIYIEAKVAFDESKEEKALKTKYNMIYDTINQISCPGYGINIESIDFISKNQAKLRKLKSFFQKNIDENAPIYALPKRYNHQDKLDRFLTYEDEDIIISISLYPTDVNLTRPIIAYLGGSFMGGSDGSLKNAIKVKAKHYGNPDKPFIICINSLSIKHTSTEDVYNALFGIGRRFSDDDLNRKNQDFNIGDNGVFHNSVNPLNTRVSGVFITRVFTSNLHVADHWLVEHPFTNNDLDFDNLDLSYIHADSNQLKEVKKKAIGEIIINA